MSKKNASGCLQASLAVKTKHRPTKGLLDKARFLA
jgi:hypothetical protein